MWLQYCFFSHEIRWNRTRGILAKLRELRSEVCKKNCKSWKTKVTIWNDPKLTLQIWKQASKHLQLSMPIQPEMGLRKVQKAMLSTKHRWWYATWIPIPDHFNVSWWSISDQRCRLIGFGAPSLSTGGQSHIRRLISFNVKRRLSETLQPDASCAEASEEPWGCRP